MDTDEKYIVLSLERYKELAPEEYQVLVEGLSKSDWYLGRVGEEGEYLLMDPSIETDLQELLDSYPEIGVIEINDPYQPVRILGLVENFETGELVEAVGIIAGKARVNHKMSITVDNPNESPVTVDAPVENETVNPEPKSSLSVSSVESTVERELEPAVKTSQAHQTAVAVEGVIDDLIHRLMPSRKEVEQILDSRLDVEPQNNLMLIMKLQQEDSLNMAKSLMRDSLSKLDKVNRPEIASQIRTSIERGQYESYSNYVSAHEELQSIQDQIETEISTAKEQYEKQFNEWVAEYIAAKRAEYEAANPVVNEDEIKAKYDAVNEAARRVFNASFEELKHEIFSKVRNEGIDGLRALSEFKDIKSHSKSSLELAGARLTQIPSDIALASTTTPAPAPQTVTFNPASVITPEQVEPQPDVTETESVVEEFAPVNPSFVVDEPAPEPETESNADEEDFYSRALRESGELGEDEMTDSPDEQDDVEAVFDNDESFNDEFDKVTEGSFDLPKVSELQVNLYKMPESTSLITLNTDDFLIRGNINLEPVESQMSTGDLREGSDVELNQVEPSQTETDPVDPENIDVTKANLFSGVALDEKPQLNADVPEFDSIYDEPVKGESKAGKKKSGKLKIIIISAIVVLVTAIITIAGIAYFSSDDTPDTGKTPASASKQIDSNVSKIQSNFKKGDRLEVAVDEGVIPVTIDSFNNSGAIAIDSSGRKWLIGNDLLQKWMSSHPEQFKKAKQPADLNQTEDKKVVDKPDSSDTADKNDSDEKPSDGKTTDDSKATDDIKKTDDTKKTDDK